MSTLLTVKKHSFFLGGCLCLLLSLNYTYVYSQGSPTQDGGGDPFNILSCDFNCTSNDLMFVASDFFLSTTDGPMAENDSVSVANCPTLAIGTPLYLCVQIENSNNGTREPLYFAAEGSYNGASYDFSTCFDDPAYLLSSQGQRVTLCSDISFAFSGDCDDVFEIDESVVGANTGGDCSEGTSCEGNTAVFQPSKCLGIADINIVLPVELIDFQVHAQKGDAVLKWATASEIDFSHFEVQYANDGKSFVRMDKVNGRGSNFNQAKYELSYKLSSGDDHYFRLKMIDLDGAYEYSPIVHLKNDWMSEYVDVFPNPFVDQLFITLDELEGTAQLFAADGQLVLAQSSQNGRITLSTTDLPAGVYMLKVQANGFTYSRRIVK